ncbi:DedA family protein [Lapillicoccus jejuensis]|uniref:Membrane-associated protein n=1 Tax=Lapillicoccus jejuensis TaxID=402171 RepID=A0A542E3R5_9MICO|nr:VTT domain-containing protein [Lapillicoccus jejuensis]TQJ09939.1 membrane-associated protein [Lapillicoccus jejuensis]
MTSPLLAPSLAPTLGPSWLDPNQLFETYGAAFVVIALVIVFVECGLLFPVLPGDSLLFAVGLFIAAGKPHLPSLPVALAAFAVAAFLGNVVGYELGRLLGRRLYERDGRIVKRRYFDQSRAFFDRNGNKALVIGRFVPVVRTYVTLVAGASQMSRRRFFEWSAVGALLWVLVVTLLGYFLGNAFPAIGKNLDAAIVVIVVLSLIPVAIEWWRHRKAVDDAL